MLRECGEGGGVGERPRLQLPHLLELLQVGPVELLPVGEEAVVLPHTDERRLARVQEQAEVDGANVRRVAHVELEPLLLEGLEVVELELARRELLVERPGLLLELLGEVLVLLLGAGHLFGCLLPSCVQTNAYTVS